MAKHTFMPLIIIVTALLFGAPKDDFDFIMDINEEGIPEIYECYKNAFEIIYI